MNVRRSAQRTKGNGSLWLLAGLLALSCLVGDPASAHARDRVGLGQPKPEPAASPTEPPAEDTAAKPGQPAEGAKPAEAPAGDKPAAPKPAPQLDRSNPQATVQTFLLAMQDALGDQPSRIDAAVACLDTKAIEGDDRVERTHRLATRLYQLLSALTIPMVDIPTEPTQPDVLLFRVPESEFVSSEGQLLPPEIRLAQDPTTKEWLFTSLTLTSIPALEDYVKAKATAQPKPAADAEIPAGRASARAAMATFLEAMNQRPPDLATAIRCLDPRNDNPDTWGVRSNTLASQLKNVMDKIKAVTLAEIPDDPNAPPYTWYTSDAGNIALARVTDVPDVWKDTLRPGEWRFTPKTLERIGTLYAQLEEQDILPELQAVGVREQLTWGLWLQKQMPDTLRVEVFQLALWKWVALLLVALAAWLIGRLMAWILGVGLASWLRRRRIAIDPEVRRRGLQATGTFAAVVIWLVVIQLQVLGLAKVVLDTLLPILYFAVAITGLWCGYRVVDVIGGYIARNKEIRLSHFDEMLVPLLRTVLRMVVVLVVLLFALNYWFETPPKTALGALGIGGVALAFAAKDTLGNFFGSLTVLFDRPFKVGDWINMGGVDGTVEEVGFRSTRVRTFYNSMITIPNSKMVDNIVDNYGARRYRRSKTMISITYATPPEKIDAFCEGIRELIRLHPYTRKDYYHVYFNQFAASSLDILLYVFFEVPDWATELRERHCLFLDIVRLANRLGIDFAFPTQTVWLHHAGAEAEPGAPTDPAGADSEQLGYREAAALFARTYGQPPAIRTPVSIEGQPRSRQEQDGDASPG